MFLLLTISSSGSDPGYAITSTVTPGSRAILASESTWYLKKKKEEKKKGGKGGNEGRGQREGGGVRFGAKDPTWDFPKIQGCYLLSRKGGPHELKFQDCSSDDIEDGISALTHVLSNNTKI